MRTKLAILIALISLLLGYFFRDAVTSSAGNHESLLGRVEPSTRELSIRLHRRSLERTMRMPESTQRWLHLVALLENAKVNEMQGIAESIGSGDKQIITLVAQRWFELDPRHYFEACLLETKRTSQGEPATFALTQFLDFLAMKWPQHDPAKAVEAFASPDSERYLEKARDQFVNHLVKIDAHRAIKLQNEWETGLLWSNGEGYLRIATKADPRGIAETISARYPKSSPPSQSNWTNGINLIGVLARIWGETNPTEALAFAKAQQNDQGDYLYSRTMQTWSKNDPSSAAQWLKEQDDVTQKKYRHFIEEVKETEDP